MDDLNNHLVNLLTKKVLLSETVLLSRPVNLKDLSSFTYSQSSLSKSER